MKKFLLLFVLVIGIVFVGTTQIGAKMNNEITQVKASHILVTTEKEAAEIKDKIDNGSITFEQAAKDYSKCPSKAQGGDLGYFGRKMMVKEFEQAAFDAPKNTVVGPIETQFGWHLIKVVDKK